MMGMNVSMMTGGNGGIMMIFGWLIYVLLVVLIVFGIAALLKYLNK